MKVRRSRSACATGAVMAEIAVMMPLFLVLIFFILWLGVTANARQSLTSATENSVRLAGTRGRGEIVRQIKDDRFVGALPIVDDWQSGAGADPRVDQLLLSSATEDRTLYDRAVQSVYGQGSRLQDLPPHYAYAVAYANEAMRLSIGGTVRYPCVVGETKGLQDDDACLFCRPVNPITLDDQMYVGQEDAAAISYRVIALRCDYAPSGILFGVAQRLLATVTGGDADNARVEMSRVAVFDAFLR